MLAQSVGGSAIRLPAPPRSTRPQLRPAVYATAATARGLRDRSYGPRSTRPQLRPAVYATAATGRGLRDRSYGPRPSHAHDLRGIAWRATANCPATDTSNSKPNPPGTQFRRTIRLSRVLGYNLLLWQCTSKGVYAGLIQPIQYRHNGPAPPQWHSRRHGARPAAPGADQRCALRRPLARPSPHPVHCPAHPTGES